VIKLAFEIWKKTIEIISSITSFILKFPQFSEIRPWWWQNMSSDKKLIKLFRVKINLFISQLWVF